MPLVVFHTRRVREALKRPEAWGADLFFLAAVAGAIGLLFVIMGQAAAPYRPAVEIDLSFAALPKYTMLSLARGFAAYVLSLAFTLVYGTVAAHNHRAEKVMLPALDVLQALPVLSFLPAVVLAMIRLFPTTELGLEIACIVTIFTGQAWNMTFSFHGSLRSIPQPLREVSKIQRLSNWQVFRLLEVPAAMIGLVWNSMMSMAGGWFFLTVSEAFTLQNQDYRLPGIGSYMMEAINRGDVRAQIAAVVAMMIMIVAVDRLFWQPIVVWSQRFKLEDSAGADTAQSWVLDVLTRSRIYHRLLKVLHRMRAGREEARSAGAAGRLSRATTAGESTLLLRKVTTWIGLAIGAALVLWGGWKLLVLMLGVPIRFDRANHDDWISVLLALLASFARTSAAVVLGAAWTLPAGILIGLSPRWSRRLQPVIQVVASFPAPMLFPLVTLALQAAHVPFTYGCVVLMLIGAQWYILFNVIAGASAIPEDLKEVGRVYRMSRWERWRRIYLPSVFPYLVTGLVTAAGGAWNATIVAEYQPMKDHPQEAFGLGYLITDATGKGNYRLLAAGVITMAVFVVLLNRFIWKRLYHLAEERYSLNA